MIIAKAKNVFIVGIKGVAMTNLAIILKKMGKEVSGSDIKEKFITEELLRKNKISYSLGFNSSDLPDKTNLVIYSAAHGGTANPQLIEAKKRKIKIISQAEIIGELGQQFKNVIAVCGCHGKTTTSSLLVYALKKLGKRPSYLVGAPTFDNMPGGDYAGKEFFVIEADEYGVNPPVDKTPKFHFLKPKSIICTNIDFDHPDVYQDINETKQAFLKFFMKISSKSIGDLDSSLRGNDRREKRLILCADDKNIMETVKKIPKINYQTFGLSNQADFNILKNKFKLSIPGEKNRSNAGGVILCLQILGFPLNAIKKVIEGFTGAVRRFEKVFSEQGIDLYDDYAHHPNEIKATISAAREKFKGRRIIIIFQPHTYSRTKILLDEFAQELSLANYCLVLPIFASAREKKADYQISSFDIERQARNNHKKNVLAFNSKKEMLDKLREILKTNDVIFTMGAGDVYKIKNDIIKMLNVKCQNYEYIN